MSELVCEEIAHRAGFVVSVGNWVAPNGELILGKDYESHHWDTLVAYLGCKPKAGNQLLWMNNKIAVDGYIRLVFRVEVLFQVGASSIDEIWGDQLNYQRMMSIIKKLDKTDIHIFSSKFYVIGHADDIIANRLNNLQIRTRS